MARTHVAQKKKSTKKLAAGITAGVLSAALLVGGVFAWRDFQQNATNIFHSTAMNDVLLHDDFTPGENKDVYVENTGDSPLYVRVQFAEFLQIGNEVMVGGALKDTDSYVVHKYDSALLLEALSGDHDSRCHEVNEDGTLGNVCEAHKYYRWDMSGAQKIFLPNVSEQGDIVWAKEGMLGGNGQYTRKTAAGNIILMMSDYVSANAAKIAYDEAMAADPTQTAVPEPDADQKYILTVAENGCWILDNTTKVDSVTGLKVDAGNGWAYWSIKLQPFTKDPVTGIVLESGATNLLLDNVTKVVAPEDNAVYAIDVRLQATNETELSEFLKTEDMSDAAKQLFPVPEVTSVEINTGNATVFIYNATGSTAQLNTVVTGTNNSQNVIYEIENAGSNNVLMRNIIGKNEATGITINSDGVLTMTKNMEVGGTYKVTAYAQQDVSVFDDIIVKVVATPASSGDGSTGGADETIKTVTDPDGNEVTIGKNEDGTWENAKGEEVIPNFDDEIYIKDEETGTWTNPEGEEVTIVVGDDGNSYVDNGDGSYTDTRSGLVINGIPGENGATVSPQERPASPNQTTEFVVQNSGYYRAGESDVIKLQDLEGNTLNNSDFTFVPYDDGYIEVAQDGSFIVSDSLAASVSTCLTIIAKDGSYIMYNINVSPSLTFELYSLHSVISSNKSVEIGKEMSLSALVYRTGGMEEGSVINIIGKEFSIDGVANGCTVTKDTGYFHAGNVPCEVKVNVTLTAKNKADRALTISEIGGDTVVESGELYTRTGVITVTVNPQPSPESDMATSFDGDWNTLEPAPAYASGDGTKANPYVIETVRQLKKLDADITTDGTTKTTYKKYFLLAADLDFSGATVETNLVGTMYGFFDGGNHKIENLVSSEGTVFASLEYGAIENLIREGGSSAFSFGSGGILGSVKNSAVISNCHNSANVVGPNAAGIVGSVRGSVTIKDCTNSGSARNGIVGFINMPNATSSAVIQNCANYGSLAAYTTDGSNCTGGIVGFVHKGGMGKVTLISNHNEGAINGSHANNAGTILGRAYKSTNGTNAVYMSDNTAAAGKISVEGILQVPQRNCGQLDAGVVFNDNLLESNKQDA